MTEQNKAELKFNFADIESEVEKNNKGVRDIGMYLKKVDNGLDELKKGVEDLKNLLENPIISDNFDYTPKALNMLIEDYIDFPSDKAERETIFEAITNYLKDSPRKMLTEKSIEESYQFLTPFIGKIQSIRHRLIIDKAGYYFLSRAEDMQNEVRSLIDIIPKSEEINSIEIKLKSTYGTNKVTLKQEWLIKIVFYELVQNITEVIHSYRNTVIAFRQYDVKFKDFAENETNQKVYLRKKYATLLKKPCTTLMKQLVGIGLIKRPSDKELQAIIGTILCYFDLLMDKETFFREKETDSKIRYRDYLRDTTKNALP